MTMMVDRAAGLPPAAEVYKSAALLALIPDDVARYWARVTGHAEIHGVTVNLYAHGRCDWLGCYADPTPNGPATGQHAYVVARFCDEHRRSHGDRVRAQLIAAARASRARRAGLLASLRQIVDNSAS